MLKWRVCGKVVFLDVESSAIFYFSIGQYFPIAQRVQSFENLNNLEGISVIPSNDQLRSKTVKVGHIEHILVIFNSFDPPTPREGVGEVRK